MKDRITDPEVAVAHLILVRDGLLSIDDFFEKTRHIPNRYIRYYSKSLGYDEARQICYESYIESIKTYPIGNKANFFAWSGMTIFRNLMEEIRRNIRADKIKTRASQTPEQTIAEIQGPEEAYFAAELPYAVNREIDRLGSVYRDSIRRHLGDGHTEESYFKSRRHAQEGLRILSQLPSLKDYNE